MSPALTPKQKQVLEFIEAFRKTRGYAPSQQEIASRFGFRSLGTVQNYLVRLERLGLIKRSWNAKRAVEVLAEEPRAVALPLAGRVAAGRPIEAVQSSDAIELPASLVGSGEHVVLRVAGDSMIGDGILDGDYLVVRRQHAAENGQTVIALVDGEATVKRFHRLGGRVELRPANPALSSLWVGEGQDLRIEGVVVGLFRTCCW